MPRSTTIFARFALTKVSEFKMVRTSLRNKQTVNYNEDHNDDKMPKAKVAARAITTASKIVENANGVASKSVAAKAITKRKAEPEAEPENAAPAPAVKAAKKRKTKAKDEDATPLADRTAISTLKPAMHIGAHVSAAGGTCTSSSVLRAHLLTFILQEFRTLSQMPSTLAQTPLPSF